MKYLSLYSIPIGYLLVYSMAILASGLWLFLLSQGLASSDLIVLIHKIIEAPMEKSYHSLIEISTPHLFSMAVLIFVIAHFMLFSKKISLKFSKKVSLLLFALAIVNIFAYFFISLGLVVSGWIKIVSLFFFVLVFIFLLGLVAFSL